MQVLDNFESSYNKFLDARQSWDSLEALQANTDILMPNGFKVFCKEENKWYILSTEDETDPSTYTWNESEGISVIELTQAEYDLLVENEEVENDRLYLITDGENYEGGSGGKGFDIVDEMPDTAPEKSIVFYNGTSTIDYAKRSFYQMINGNWTFLGATVKLIEIPFSLSLESISPISENERNRVLTFTSSEEIAITQETFNGVTASGVIQGKIWNDIGGSISQVDKTTFRVILDIDATDSLGQPAQFVSGSSITIPAFSWIDGITKYTHSAETINISETTVQQKLLFSATGNFDTNTASTSFVISSAYEIPFELTEYSNISTIPMMDETYENEITQTWIPSIVAENDSTVLVFTPNNSTALHGDNITINSGVLTATSNGVTYTCDFSIDNINLRWGNTSYNLGTFNNFASFTAVPTSINSGSVTCTLSPTGPGDDQFELDIMAANLPTVTINSVQCGTVAWTQGQIVASGASGVTTVGGKTIDITWASDTYTDTDSYGITRIVTFAAKALSATCGYIQQTIVLSSPTPSTSNNALSMAFTTDVTALTTYTLASSDYSASATGVLQATATTVSSNGTATYTGTSFTINSFANSTDVFSQRIVFPSGYDSVTVGSFDFAFGDCELIHSSQTLSCTESTIADQELNMNDTSNYTLNYSLAGWRYFSLASKFSAISGACYYTMKYINSSLEVATVVDAMTSKQSYDEGRSFACGASDQLFWGSLQPITFSPITHSGLYITTTCLGVTWKISNQTMYVEPKGRSLQWSLSGTTSVASVTSDNSYDTYINLYGVSGYEDPFKSYVLSSINSWTVTVGSYSETITPTSIMQLSNPLALRITKSNYYPEALKGSGTTTIVFNTVSQTYEVPNSDGFTVEYNCPGGTVTGTHSYDEYYDDDDCDDD